MGRKVDESDCKCHLKSYKGSDFKIFVCKKEKEVFIDTEVEHDFYTHDGAECVTRLASKLWQHEGLESLIDQLRKSAKDDRSIPGLMANVLSLYT